MTWNGIGQVQFTRCSGQQKWEENHMSHQKNSIRQHEDKSFFWAQWQTKKISDKPMEQSSCSHRYVLFLQVFKPHINKPDEVSFISKSKKSLKNCSFSDPRGVYPNRLCSESSEHSYDISVDSDPWDFAVVYNIHRMPGSNLAIPQKIVEPKHSFFCRDH